MVTKKRKNARAKTTRKKVTKKPKATKKRGRPSKYTKAIADKIIEALERGNYITTAAKLAKIGRKTIYRWLKEYPEFNERVMEVEAGAEDAALQNVRQGVRNWQASAWYLERKHPKRWGLNRVDDEDSHRKHVLELVAPVGHTSVVVGAGDVILDPKNPMLISIVNGNAKGHKGEGPELEDPDDI